MNEAHPPLPGEFVKMIEEMLGSDAPAFFASMEAAPALALRLNPARAGVEFWTEAFSDGAVPWEPLGRYLRPDVRPGAGIAHAGAAFYLQEASAMVSVAAMSPEPGERVLDLCAAPGGKSTQIASRLAGQGLLVSNEPEPARAKILASNLERMGVRNACVVCAYPDALAARWAGGFDAVLCDTPCSGEGMFRRDPAARLQWKPSSPAGCAKRQAEILDRAAELVRPGGRLVYSTCTFNATENEQTIAAFLDRHPEFAPEEFELQGLGRSKAGMIRVWPHQVRGDGHFAAKLRKQGDGDMCSASNGEKVRANPRKPGIEASPSPEALVRALESEIGALPEGLPRRLERNGDYVYAIPEDRPELIGLRVVSPGLRLLRVGRNRVEPEHALAMALDATTFPRCLDLNDNLAARYLAGEALPCPTNLRGWMLLTWRQLPLGWGKASEGQMKNHLPKGLRQRIL